MFIISATSSSSDTLVARSIRIHCFILGIMLLSYYSSSLISLTAVKRNTLPFTSLEGLLNDGSYRITVIKNSQEYKDFKVFLKNKSLVCVVTVVKIDI